MDETYFAERLSSLRLEKNVSAREMSLAIGENESYINRIENRKCFPSMQCFFYICEYLNITPAEFFDTGKTNPARLRDAYEKISLLNDDQLDIVLTVANGLIRTKQQQDIKK